MILRHFGKDEWWGYICECPKCKELNIWEGFKYCPECGLELGNWTMMEATNDS